MPDIHHFALFLLSGLLLNMTPGADMLFIISRSAGQGVRAGAMAALGVGAGCLVHVTAAAVGLSALIAASDVAFGAVKWLGAAYLVWLGIGLLRAKTPAQGSRSTAEPMPAAPLRAVFWQGVLTNVLNPKIVLFFLAFLPQFVGPAPGGQGWAFLLLGVVFTLNGTLFNLSVAWVAARARGRMAGVGRMQCLALWVRRVTGLVFVGLGLRLALAARV